MFPPPHRSTLFPYTTLFRSNVVALARAEVALGHDDAVDPLLARAEALITDMRAAAFHPHLAEIRAERARRHGEDRKSTRLNSSHTVISYAVFCLKKKK